MENTRENRIVFWLFLAPVLFAFLMVVVIPFFLGIFYSFTDWSSSARAGAGLQFVGLENFTESLKDPSFLYSFLLSFIYTALNVLAINFVSFALALMVTSAIKGRNLYRVGFFLPNLIGGLILGYVWQFIFNNALPGLGEVWKVLAPLAEPENLVLAGRSKSVLALVVVGTWQYAGYIMMIYVAALESVPVELHEAARIDGVSTWTVLWEITLPLLKPTIVFIVVFSSIGFLRIFDHVFNMTTQNPGGPLNSTKPLVLMIYQTAFSSFDMGYAAAQTVVLFLVLLVVSLMQLRILRDR